MDPRFKPSDFEQRLLESREDRKRVRRLVQTGNWRSAETDATRTRAFNTRKLAVVTSSGAEAIQGSTNDLQPVSFLLEGSEARRSIAYVEVNDARQSTSGTGFLISPRLFITNQHVIADANAARAAQITFDRELRNGRPNPATTYLLAPEAFVLFSPENMLDYAIVAVGQRISGGAPLEELGFLPLSNSPDRHVLGMNVNIIHHPNGVPKMISVRSNLLTARGKDGRTLLYETDTEHGSSGAPVMNDLWDVVALHHWSEPYLASTDEAGQPVPRNVNEGVRISAIFQDLLARLPTLPAPQRLILNQALEAAAQTQSLVPQLSGPRPRSGAAESLPIPPSQASVPNSKPLIKMNTSNEIRLTLPLEVTVRLGVEGLDALTAQSTEPAAKPKLLTRGAEAKKLDKDYTNREGYIPNHIPGASIPLPKAPSSDVAPLRATEPDAASGELKYQHFTVVMHKARRLALFTATNIDGETYLRVDRDTGKVVGGAEGETWYKDPRISESFWTGQDFYSEWSTYFDRGHLTRRTDPTWGDDAAAERANADTFHFTNCSPQHFRFNQTTAFWQGAERYVLENGLLAAETKKRVSVFQGPIWDDTIDNYAGDLQIPSSFFKIIVWKSSTGLKSVGLIVDQLPLLSESRINLGQPTNVPSVNVSQWRVSIKKIQERTGLDFGKKVRDADTINEPGQVDVGAEALIRITKLEDLLPRLP